MKKTTKVIIATGLCFTIAISISLFSHYSISKQNIKRKEEIAQKLKKTAQKKTITQKKSTTQQNNSSHQTKIICIDAGHQGKGDLSLEAIGPNSPTKKPKVTYGTSGVVSKVAESVVTLQVALKLQKVLENRGYKVIMVRTSQNVNISNKERAFIANNSHADAFLRLHCDSADNQSISGTTTLAPSSNNPYLSQNVIQNSQRLSTLLGTYLTKSTQSKNKGVYKVNNMSGINWCKVPVSIIEMGFMSNPIEDKNLTSSSYQDLIAQGLANGLDAYFK